MRIQPLPDFAPWAAARFQTEEARDRFLSVVTTQQTTGVEITPMPHESCAALVRWRPGQFLGLNDVAYAHGGRIIISFTPESRGHDRPPSPVRARRGFRVINNA